MVRPSSELPDPRSCRPEEEGEIWFISSLAFSFSFSLTFSSDFFLERPATLSTVVARCNIVTLPLLGLEVHRESLRSRSGEAGIVAPNLGEVEGGFKGELL